MRVLILALTCYCWTKFGFVLQESLNLLRWSLETGFRKGPLRPLRWQFGQLRPLVFQDQPVQGCPKLHSSSES